MKHSEIGRRDIARAPWQKILLALLLVVAGLHTLRPLWNTDLFWHLSSGRLFLEQAALPDEDPLTHTAGQNRWVHHEWGSQVLLAGAEGLVGLGGLRGLRALLTVLGLALLAWFRRHHGDGLPLVAVAWLGLVPNASLRPHLVVWPLAVWMLAAGLPSVLDPSRRTPSLRSKEALRWVLMAAAVVVWVNLHSSALVVPLLLGVHAAGSVLDRFLGRLRSWQPAGLAAGAAGLTAAACLLQPSGVELFTYASTTPSANLRSQEWASLFEATTWQAFPWVLVAWAGLVASTLILGVIERRRGVVTAAFPSWWVALACLALAAQHRRMSLFFFVSALYVLPRLAPYAIRWRQDASLRFGRALIGAALATVLVVAFAALPDAIAKEALRPGVFPERAADFLVAADLRGHLFHDINWGGYLGFRRHPHQQVFADGRWLLAGPEVMADYPRLYLRTDLPDKVEELFVDYGIEVLVQPTRDMLERPGLSPRSWRLAWIGPMATVLVRHGEAYPDNYERLCRLYRQHPELEARALWPVEVQRPDGGPSPTDIPAVWSGCPR